MSSWGFLPPAVGGAFTVLIIAEIHVFVFGVQPSGPRAWALIIASTLLWMCLWFQGWRLIDRAKGEGPVS